MNPKSQKLAYKPELFFLNCRQPTGAPRRRLPVAAVHELQRALNEAPQTMFGVYRFRLGFRFLAFRVEGQGLLDFRGPD